jgi:Na+-driven multidrug efflux pump
VVYLRSGHGAIGLPLDPRRIQGRLLADILRVGGLSAIGTVQMNLTVALVTGLVGWFGADAVAGYGIASRLDYLLIPLLFGLGTSALTMVGTNIGAGQRARARRVAWTAAALAGIVTEIIGIAASSFPNIWLGMFTTEPKVLATGALYSHHVAPFYGFVGVGMLLYFSGQGAGHVTWPVIAGTARLAIAGFGGWLIVAELGLGLQTLFVAVATASIAYGGITAIATLLGPWRPEPVAPPQAERASAS